MTAVLRRPTRSGIGLGTILLACSVFLSGFGKPTLFGNVTVGDLAIGAMMALCGVHVVSRHAVVGPIARRFLPSAYLMTLGTLVASLGVGFAPWVINDLIRDVAVGAAFVAALDVVLRDGVAAGRIGWAAISASTAVVSFQVLAGSSQVIRAQATFPNPNVAGHFLATTMFTLLMLPGRLVVSLPVTLLALAALIQTSSFGAILQLATCLGALGLFRVRDRLADRPHLWRGLLVGAAVGVVATIAVVPQLLPSETGETGISAERLARSARERGVLWRTGLDLLEGNPLGVGPGTTGALQLLNGEKELHNEGLAFLVERGVIGFVGLVLLYVALWRLAPRASASRALLLGLAMSSLVRQTSHYRHLWLCLALLIGLDLLRARRQARLVLAA